MARVRASSSTLSRGAPRRGDRAVFCGGAVAFHPGRLWGGALRSKNALDRMFSHMARGSMPTASRRGRGYDLCPHVTIADIIEQIRHACLSSGAYQAA